MQEDLIIFQKELNKKIEKFEISELKKKIDST